MTRLNTIRIIHVGCRQLGIDGETRRDLQLLVTGKASITDMVDADLTKMITALKDKGFKPHGGGARAKRPAAPRADIRFAHVIWGKLYQAGKVDLSGAKGLNAFVRARFEKTFGAVPIDIDQMRDAKQIAMILEALKAMAARAGITL